MNRVALSPVKAPLTALLVDPDPRTRQAIAASLRLHGYVVSTADGGGGLLSAARRHAPDIAVFDLALPDIGGLEALAQLKETNPGICAVVVTEAAAIETAVAAIRAGADDYIAKSVAADALPASLERAIAHRAASARGSDGAELQPRRQPAKRDGTVAPVMIGSTPEMIQVYKTIARTADLDATVLIVGETGSGKEQIARAIHRAGRRAAAPFIAIDCASVPEALFESEFFGHERGAFTGATSSRKGVLEAAGEGTCFLDEVGELPLHQQAKLLRALQERAVRRVGSSHSIPISARIICATNRDLADQVQAGTFREDLYYRLNVVTLRLPPLRARPDDIRRLAEHFVGRATPPGKVVPVLSREALDVLARYPWPGNVRQLENVIERTVALTPYDVILVSDLPVEIIEANRLAERIGGDAFNAGDPVAIRDLTRRHIDEVLRKTGGNKLRAAQVLGIDRRTLYRILERSRPTEPPREN